MVFRNFFNNTDYRAGIGVNVDVHWVLLPFLEFRYTFIKSGSVPPELFTFHNVSIIKFAKEVIAGKCFIFHNVPIKSTLSRLESLTLQGFTFLNVSIKSNSKVYDWFSVTIFTFLNISIKFFLCFCHLFHCHSFTLQNVSINSIRGAFPASGSPFFTFQNVSINSSPVFLCVCTRMHIYIPQCLY